MSHEITQLPNGAYEAMFANRPAWHKLGKVYKPGESDGLTSAVLEKQLPSVFSERILAELGVIPNSAGDVVFKSEIRDAGNFRAVMRRDTGRIHGIVKRGYRIWQVREAFEFLDGLVANGDMEYESVFSIRGGDYVTVLARLPNAFVAGKSGNDASLSYVYVKIPFTGDQSILILPTRVRVVCANTMAYAESNGGKLIWRIRHSQNLDEKLEQAQDYLAGFDEALQRSAEHADVLSDYRLDKTETEAFLEDMFPTVDDEGEPLRGRKATNREKKIGALRRAWTDERDILEQIGEETKTAWHMLNAVTRAVDHDYGLFSTRGKGREAQENEFERIMEGIGADLKQKSEEKLLALATA